MCFTCAPAPQVSGECKQMTSPGVFPVRTSSLPLFIIFLLLNSLLNRLHSRSHESGIIGKDIRAPVSLLEPKFSLHKWAHGYTCSYRWFWLHSWIYFQEYIDIDHTCFRDPRPICSECIVRPQLWHCVGRTRSVFSLIVTVRWKNKVGFFSIVAARWKNKVGFCELVTSLFGGFGLVTWMFGGFGSWFW